MYWERGTKEVNTWDDIAICGGCSRRCSVHNRLTTLVSVYRFNIVRGTHQRNGTRLVDCCKGHHRRICSHGVVPE